MRPRRKPTFTLTQGLEAVRSTTLRALLEDHKNHLTLQGYRPLVIQAHLLATTHFVLWVEREGRQIGDLDDASINSFERHRGACRCPAASRARFAGVRSSLRTFLQHLRDRGITSTREIRPEAPPLVGEFLEWVRSQRGLAPTTIATYQSYITDFVSELGDKPRDYSARGLRAFVEKRCRHYQRNSTRMVVAAVRLFLRFLAEKDLCRAGLEHAVPSTASCSLDSLPRGLSDDDVAKVLASCPSTPTGMRDRAVLLLLLRLGLRAGDIAALRFTDLCFGAGTIRVAGKGRRESLLPLPQDVGDALLRYLKEGRPQISSEFVFLRSIAPFRPFAGRRQPGQAISHIAGAALARSDVQTPARGSHVFRHTAACKMLRQGVGLEEIAQVLRHESIRTTGIYAKVDRDLLLAVAQPWPEVSPC